MHLIPQLCRLVIPGAWNPSIFSFPWLADRLKLETPAPFLDVALLSNGVQLQFAFRDLILTVSSTVLTLEPRKTLPVNLELLEHVARQLLTVLGETPLMSFGVNHGVRVERGALRNADAMLAPAAGAFARAVGPLLSSSTAFSSGDPGERQTNISVRTDAKAGIVQIEVNHHRVVSGAEDARARLAGSAAGDLALTKRVLQDCFGIEIQEPA